MPKDKNSQPPIIKVLDEKDKIITSLRKSSSERDKSNASQIRILSIDGEQKIKKINTLKDETHRLNSQLQDMSTKLAAYEEKEGNFEHLKQAVENYRQYISTSLKELKDLVTKELTNRDNKNEATTQQLRKNYQELENKMNQAQAQYKSVLGSVFNKQKMAKTFIRKSLINIQEALNVLDTNSTDLMIDESIYQNFSQLLNNSQEAFNELESKNRGNSTIIENIENLNLKLQIDEGLAEAFNAIGKSLTTPANSSDSSNIAPQTQASGGQSSNIAPQTQAGGGQSSNIAPQTQAGGGQSSNIAPQTQASGGQYFTATNQPIISQSPITKQPYSNMAQPTPPHFGNNRQPVMDQQFTSQGSVALSPQQQSEPIITQQQDEDLIMRESPNLAPYDWNMLASTSTLLRFRKMLNSAIRAEEKENWTKALYIYNTVKIQRTVKDDALAINMLEDQIEAINRRARSSVSNNVKRDKIIKAYEKRKKSDK